MMKTFQILILLAAGLSVNADIEVNGLFQFWRIIRCVIPDSWPIWDFADYGCYCGKGGSGTPVDDLDRCCQVHDNCYGEAEKHPKCPSIFDNPYTNGYRHSCDWKNKKVTCSQNNDECEQFICECDRKAAECFAKSTFIPEHKHLDQSLCKDEESKTRQNPVKPKI